MTVVEKLMAEAGTYTLPYLIHLYSPDNSVNLYLINDNKSVTYNENEYKPAAFSYTPNADSSGFSGGGTFTVAAKERNLIIPLVDTYKEVYMEVIAVLNEKGTISELKKRNHHFASVSFENDKATFTFSKDDRLSMNFPSLIWNRLNNRGNS